MSAAASETEAGGVDSLTLEFNDNPLESFMRRIERLVDLDPAEAFRMARHALEDKAFGAAAEARLEAKMTELAAAMRQERSLGAAFTVSASGWVPPPAANVAVPSPVPSPPKPAWAPAPFGMAA